MAGVNFVNQQTIIRTDWLQGVNDLFYRVFQVPTNLEDIRVILPVATQENKGLMSPDDLIKLNDIDSPFGIRNLEVEIVASSRTLVREDRYKYLRTTSIGVTEITIPTNASVPFEIGEFVYVEKGNVGSVLFSASPGVTLTTPGALGIAEQHNISGLIKVNTDEWLIVNNEIPFATLAGDLAIGTDEFPFLHTYDLATGNKINNPLDTPTGPVERVQYSTDGQLLAVLSETDNLIVYDTSTYQQVELSAQPLMTVGRGLAFSPDNEILIARNTGYNTSDWSVIENDVFDLGAGTLASGSVTYRPDKVFVVSGNTTPINPTSLSGGRVVRDGITLGLASPAPGGITGQVRANTHTPDGAFYVYCKNTDSSQPLMATASTATFYNPFQPNIPFTDPPSTVVNAVKYTSTGGTLVVGDTEAPYLKLYDPSNGDRLADPLQTPGQINDMVTDHSIGRIYIAHDNAPFFTIRDETTFAEIEGPEESPGANANTISTPNSYGGS